MEANVVVGALVDVVASTEVVVATVVEVGEGSLSALCLTTNTSMTVSTAMTPSIATPAINLDVRLSDARWTSVPVVVVLVSGAAEGGSGRATVGVVTPCINVGGGALAEAIPGDRPAERRWLVGSSARTGELVTPSVVSVPASSPSPLVSWASRRGPSAAAARSNTATRSNTVGRLFGSWAVSYTHLTLPTKRIV